MKFELHFFGPLGCFLTRRSIRCIQRAFGTSPLALGPRLEPHQIPINREKVGRIIREGKFRKCQGVGLGVEAEVATAIDCMNLPVIEKLRCPHCGKVI